MPYIFQLCCSRCGMTEDEALASKRAICVSVRHIAMFVMRRTTLFTTAQIAAFFAIDHGSVCYATNNLRHNTNRYLIAMEILNDIEQLINL